MLRCDKNKILTGCLRREGAGGLSQWMQLDLALLVLILVTGAAIPSLAVAASPVSTPSPSSHGGNKVERATSLSLEQLKNHLKKFSIRIICWNPDDLNAVIKVRNPDTLSRGQWRKIISESFANKLFVKKGNETIIYLLPAGISSKRVLAVTSYTATTIDPFIEFDSKALAPVESMTDLPEIILLQQFGDEEKKSGIYYERFVNPPDAVSAYSFKVEYVPQLQAMMSITEKSTSTQELTGFPSSGGVLEFIQSQTDSQWLQMRSKSGYLYLTTSEANAPLFTIQQNKDGRETIAMRSTMPNGTPFSYTIVKTDNTFTSTTNLVSSKGPITLLDFATLGGTP